MLTVLSRGQYRAKWVRASSPMRMQPRLRNVVKPGQFLANTSTPLANKTKSTLEIVKQSSKIT